MKFNYPPYKIMRPILVCFLLAISAQSGNAQQKPLHYKTRAAMHHDVMKAETIVYCSDFEELNNTIIHEFASAIFPNQPLPSIINAKDGWVSNAADATVFFYAGAKIVKPATQDCLNSLNGNNVDLLTEVNKLTKVLGTRPDNYKIIPYGKYFTPVFATYTSYKVANNSFAMYVSIAEPPERTMSSLSFLFGLKINFCSRNKACMTFYNKRLKADLDD